MTKTLRSERHTFTRTALAVAAFLAAVALFGGPVRAQQVTEDNLAQKIETAKTAADHEAIAAFYQAKATASTEEAKRHEAMLASYKKIGGKMYQAWENHCKSLIQSYNKEAKDYEMLAKEHEKMAKAAGGK